MASIDRVKARTTADPDRQNDPNETEKTQNFTDSYLTLTRSFNLVLMSFVLFIYFVLFLFFDKLCISV